MKPGMMDKKSSQASGTLPMDSPLAMPEGEVWRQWVAEASARAQPSSDYRLAPILSSVGEDEGESGSLSWRGEPDAGLRCDLDGRLYLIGAYLSAWQGIDLPRQRDNPDREPDDGPEEGLAGLPTRVRRALKEWEDCLGYLYPELAGWTKGK
jgi:hypothetical protein